ncbi:MULTISPECIES: class F sortase [unclassified Streptomyces]|uniref:class F sortase n=1 Tax=unclassified Streptomyces TaxID=2593676 RepID=UPI0022388C7C|nr:class F sortase [Streptomyces sp. SHP 1-2]MCW5249885.1 class F sortase [Streptomyces sp. SHP 1-2]
MTPSPGRALAAAALAVLLAGCGTGSTDGADGPETGGGRSARPGGTAPAASHTTGTPTPAGPVARSAPVGLSIPAIGVDTPVIPLGLAADGTVEVPPVAADDPAGWYRHSPTPGRTGPSVLLGHVTVGRFGDGVFRHLDRLRPGDRAVARLEDGTAAEFTVTSVRTVARSAFPTEDVYGDVDRPELRLITCGGPRSGDGYRDNVIVFAKLTGVRPRL